MGENTKVDFSFLSDTGQARQFDVSSPTGVVELGLYQLECMLEAGTHSIPKSVVLADINAYKTILAKDLCREYKNWKKRAIISGTKERMPRHFVMEKKLYANFD